MSYLIVLPVEVLIAIRDLVVGLEGTVIWTPISLTGSSLKRNSQTNRGVPRSFSVQRVLSDVHIGMAGVYPGMGWATNALGKGNGNLQCILFRKFTLRQVSGIPCTLGLRGV